VVSFRRIWRFLWFEDSPASWIVSIVLAFLIVKFIIYPVIGLVLGTGFPIVAVVSESMQHKADCSGDCDTYRICGEGVDQGGFYSLNEYWSVCGEWYENREITRGEFMEFPFKNGFNKGDIMILIGKEAKDIKVGDVVVFDGNLNYPIIHRAVAKWQKEETYYFETKGDNNGMPSGSESEIHEDKLLGKAVIRLPLLGWVKIWFSSAAEFIIGGIK
jgi:signal peptidase I